MPIQQTITLLTPVEALPEVGPTRGRALRRLGLRCVADLILHLPHRYVHQHSEDTIANASITLGPRHGDSANIAARGEVGPIRFSRAKKPRFETTLFDGTGTIKLTWFNAAWMRHKIHPGMMILVRGRAERYGDYIEMTNPQWELIKPGVEPPAEHAERFAPIYPAGEELSSNVIERLIDSILDEALAQLPDHLTDEYRRKLALPGLAESYGRMHRPKDEEDLAGARRRLAFDELLFLQLAVMMKRHHRRAMLKAPRLKFTDAIDAHIRKRLPFVFTDSQNHVIGEIVPDLRREAPMNRLLQGDVGAGKTVVALYAALMAVASGHQAAVMAPTELLAEQHMDSICDILRGSRVAIDLLTGSLKPAQRSAVLKRIESGETDLVIGTHALLTETVNLKSLAVAVIDEQHRFGVHQRATLRAKSNDAKTTPHVLVMTATPIPRTLSLTLFGDLDSSIIRFLPPGRQPIMTMHFTQARRHEAYERVASRLRNKEQAYIVVPLIDESESGLTDLTTHLDRLQTGPLSQFQLASMHGRLNHEDRERIMNRFRKGGGEGGIDALVATTVIEVGVDVPNATVMVIENADRFGLAQLHQLRGRVGRGEKASECLLIADPITPDGQARVDAMLKTGDGFEIAEKDLEIRGPGELFGARQSGLPPFRVADFSKDIELLRLARREATQWIDANPTLAGDEHALLRKRLFKAYGEALGLGDVA